MTDGTLWDFVGSGAEMTGILFGETLCCVSDFHLIVGRKVPKVVPRKILFCPCRLASGPQTRKFD